MRVLVAILVAWANKGGCLMSHLVDENLFLPSSTDMIDGIVAEYRQTRSRIEQVADSMSATETQSAVAFFLAGQTDRQYNIPSVSKLFSLEPAIAALNSHYWSIAMKKTDVLEVMPQARRDEWFSMIREKKCPDFEESTVRSTLDDLLASRYRFFAEKIDGVFRGLSNDHVTNEPKGFYKRMILNYVFDDWGSVKYEKSGIIHDLRQAIARLENREEVVPGSTDTILRYARKNTGQWMPCDGGRIKVKAFLKGTCHIEIHPDIAVMLNIVLASLYPLAIPASFRTKRAKPTKEWPLMQRPLPYAVLKVLQSATLASVATGNIRHPYEKKEKTISIPIYENDRFAIKEAELILESIGGVYLDHHWQFDYDALSVVKEIVATGCVPDRKSHQFYPTPKPLGQIAIDLADIGDDDLCAEPSAGIGNIADLMPHKRNVTCIEVSSIHAQVLKEKGYRVLNEDFLKYAESTLSRFDRIVMNPPFEGGRWQAHLEAASKILVSDGVITAILPSSARNSAVLSSAWSCEYHGPYNNQFADASVSVCILVAKRK